MSELYFYNILSKLVSVFCTFWCGLIITNLKPEKVKSQPQQIELVTG